MANLELQRYNDFLFLINTLSYKREISQIYRGDSLENLCKKLNIEYLEENTDTNLICERLFMVGEKVKGEISKEEADDEKESKEKAKAVEDVVNRINRMRGVK